MALSRSAKFYHTHPVSRRKKAQTDAEINRRPDQVAKRVALNRYNRLHNSIKGDGQDASHHGGKITGYESAHKNRGDRNNSRGDSNARQKGRRHRR